MQRGFIVQPTWRVRSGVPVIQLWGRLEDGRAFCAEDTRCRPYFFVRAEDRALLADQSEAKLAESDLQGLAGEALVRVTVPTPDRVPRLRRVLEASGAPTFEADVRFAYRLLMDRELRGAIEIVGAGEEREGCVYFRDAVIRPGTWRPTLRVLSLDIETSPDASRLFSAAIVGSDVDEVHLISEAGVAEACCHRDERTLLEALCARVRALDPDVIVGWNVVDFDLAVLDARARALGVPFPVGRSHEPMAFQRDAGFTRQARASLPGRMVLDGIGLVRDVLRLEDYRLETVAQAVLGRGKKLDEDAPDAAAEIERLFREDPPALVAYNREDARLVLDILEREALLELTLERSLLSGMQLDRVGASIATFDLAFVPELHRRGFAAPSVERDREHVPLRGGAVLESRPGLFRDVAVFDFKSLYPSLIRTFHLDPLAHARGSREPDAIVGPGGARFSRHDAILPAVIERWLARREEARRRGDEHASQAIKIMLNSLYGVLGSPGCRFFDPEIANAITGFGQRILGWTREAFEALGVEVLYGDTDSLFVALGDGASGGSDAARAAEALRAAVEDAISQRIRTEHGVESQLVLELERVYRRFFMPRVRRGESGSKKRYAGWTERGLEVVGLEAVRRDVPEAARRLQTQLLELLFRDEPLLPLVAEHAAALRRGELDRELVYVKRIRKSSLESYTATTPPHVAAARKAGGAPRGVIRYVITPGGPEPVLSGRPFPGPIDHAHYEQKLLRPIADAILRELDQSWDEAVGAPRQLSLL